MSEVEECYNKWAAEDFIISVMERTEDIEERLVLLYDYFSSQQESIAEEDLDD